MSERNRQRSGSRSRSRRGSVVVETAIVLSVLLTGLLGIFEYGRLVMIRQIMNNAAREGARMAVVSATSEPTDTTQQIRDTVNAYLAGQAIQNVEIQIYQADPTTGASLGPWNLTPYGGSIAVQINGDYVPVLPTSLGIIPEPDPFHVVVDDVERGELTDEFRNHLALPSRSSRAITAANARRGIATRTLHARFKKRLLSGFTNRFWTMT